VSPISLTRCLAAADWPPPTALTRAPAGGSVAAVPGSPGSEPRLSHPPGRFIPSGTGVSPRWISGFLPDILSNRDRA
jgi:hypothetical protein